MTIIYLLLAVSLVVALAFFAAFVTSVRKGQFDDTYTPSVRMLFEDEVLGDTNDNPANKEKQTTKPE